jgi:hypothetical protein
MSGAQYCSHGLFLLGKVKGPGSADWVFDRPADVLLITLPAV